jgi:hypothetical protein
MYYHSTVHIRFLYLGQLNYHSTVHIQFLRLGTENKWKVSEIGASRRTEQGCMTKENLDCQSFLGATNQNGENIQKCP